MADIRKARTRVITDYPFFASGLVKLPLLEDLTEETACTDGRCIKYNPQFIATLGEEECVTLLLHEVWHVMGLHVFRRNGRDPELWNMACDHTTNHLLLGTGRRAMEGWLCDPQHKGKGPERIYSELEQQEQERQQEQQENEKDQEKQGDEGADNGSTGNEQPSEQGSAPAENGPDSDQGQPGDDGQPGEGEPGEGEGQGEGQPGEGEGQPADSTSNGGGQPADSTSKEPEGNPKTGRFVDAVNEEGETCSPAEMEEMAAEWVMNTMQAARITEKYGSLPGNIKSQVKDMQPTTPWRAVLRQFVDSTATTRSNWARPDRRFAGRGLHLPTKAGKRLKSLIIALDTSGSLLDQQAELLAEVSAALHQYPIDKVHVLHVDSQLRHVDVFSKGDVLRVEESYGGGGTDLRIPFDYADNAEENFHGIIYITDLEGPQPDDSEHRTLWLCTSPPSRAEYYLPKFGEVAYMRD